MTIEQEAFRLEARLSGTLFCVAGNNGRARQFDD